MVAPGLAIGLAWWMHEYWPSTPYVSLLLCATLFTAWFGGQGPGLLALGLSVTAFYFLFLPPLSADASSLPRLLCFGLAGLLVTMLASTQWRTTQSLRRAKDELSAKVDALRRSENYLAAAQRLSHTGCFDWRVATDEVFWSEETFHIFEYEPMAKLNLEHYLRRIHPEDLALVRQMIENARKGNDFDFDHRLLLPDDKVKHVHIMGHAEMNEAGELEFVGAVMDVTEQNRTQDALHQAQANYAHITRLTTMGEFAVSIAHEVNQPLTAVVNNANACLTLLPAGGPAVTEVRDALAEIIDDAERAGTVIARVRQLARKAPAERKLVDLREVIVEVVALARYESATRQVTIQTGMPAGLPPVLGDRVQLEQVLLNLVVNGLDAMAEVPAARRFLLIRARYDTQEDRPAVTSDVQDTGAGFAPGQLERIFEAFYTTKPQGLGMGLAISRSIIEAHGGRLWAETNQGPGATFSFCLPAAGEAGS